MLLIAATTRKDMKGIQVGIDKATTLQLYHQKTMTKAFYALSLLVLSPPNTRSTSPTKPTTQYASFAGARTRRCTTYSGNAPNGSISVMNIYLASSFRRHCNFLGAPFALAFFYSQNSSHHTLFNSTKTQLYSEIGLHTTIFMHWRCTR